MPANEKQCYMMISDFQQYIAEYTQSDNTLHIQVH